MSQPFKDAVVLCKTIMRNGFDAYVVNPSLQEKAMRPEAPEVDICTDMGLEELRKLFPHIRETREHGSFALLSESGAQVYFYPADVEDGSHPEECVAKLTPRMLKNLEGSGELPLSRISPYVPRAKDSYDGFAELGSGQVRLLGLPDETLRQDYLRAIRALRYSANYGLPIEPNTWMAITRNGRRALDYLSVIDIVDEWRKVEAENMAAFVRLLYESMILHALVPELAAMGRLKQLRNETEYESVFDHTLRVMEYYPQELPYDWYGTLACLFHDVGKLHTAEFHDGRWSFYQHHRVGAKVTRKILLRLHFTPEEADLVSHLVRHHMNFQYMLTDRGIRQFRALDEFPRLIEMVRADLKAKNGQYREFNHNMKMLERTTVPEDMLEPLLNGRMIMEYTGLNPGPAVGLIRDALLKAQIAGDVTSEAQAIEFVKLYTARELIG